MPETPKWKDKLIEMLTAKNVVITVVLVVGFTYAAADIFGSNVVAAWIGSVFGLTSK